MLFSHLLCFCGICKKISIKVKKYRYSSFKNNISPFVCEAKVNKKPLLKDDSEVSFEQKIQIWASAENKNKLLNIVALYNSMRLLNTLSIFVFVNSKEVSKKIFDFFEVKFYELKPKGLTRYIFFRDGSFISISHTCI